MSANAIVKYRVRTKDKVPFLFDAGFDSIDLNAIAKSSMLSIKSWATKI